MVPYDDVQFTKAANVLNGMGLGSLKKTPDAVAELEKKGMAPDGVSTQGGALQDSAFLNPVRI